MPGARFSQSSGGIFKTWSENSKTHFQMLSTSGILIVTPPSTDRASSLTNEGRSLDSVSAGVGYGVTTESKKKKSAFLVRVQRLTDPTPERSQATRWAASQL